MKTLKTDGGAIRVKRQAAGISQEELARRVGVTPGHLANVEYGKRGLGTETQRLVADVLDVTVEDITTLVDTDDKPAPVTA